MSARVSTPFGLYKTTESGLLLRDTTIANASTSRHGLLPKLSGSATDFLNGAGNWSVPSLTPGAGLPYMYAFKDAIDDPVNDNFALGDGAGGMDTAGTRFSGATPWAALNSPTTTVVDGKRLWLTSAASASNQMRGYHQQVPSGNYCVRMCLAIRPSNAVDGSEKTVGIYLRDSASGKVEAFGIGSTGGSVALIAWKYTNATTLSATRAFTTSSLINAQHAFVEAEYDGTNYRFRAGYSDGGLYSFGSGFTFAKTNFLTNVADQIGLFSENDQSVATTLICYGFYRVPVSSVL